MKRNLRCFLAVSAFISIFLLVAAMGLAQEAPNLALGKKATASSSAENWGWFLHCLTDGERNTVDACRGWSSWDMPMFDHTEWVQIDLESVHAIQRIVLVPRNDENQAGYGFPINFKIEVSADGSNWTEVANVTNAPLPEGPVTYEVGGVSARYVKITGAKLRSNPHDRDNFTMQFTEIEIY